MNNRNVTWWNRTVECARPRSAIAVVVHSSTSCGVHCHGYAFVNRWNLRNIHNRCDTVTSAR